MILQLIILLNCHPRMALHGRRYHHTISSDSRLTLEVSFFYGVEGFVHVHPELIHLLLVQLKLIPHILFGCNMNILILLIVLFTIAHNITLIHFRRLF